MVLHFAKATSIFVKTLPFVLLRIGVGLLLGIAAVCYFGIVVWLGVRLLEAGTISGPIGGIGLLVSVLVFVVAWRLFSRYVLYLVKAAHIAVIAHIVETGDVPSNQVQFGKSQVRSRFSETSALFAVDQLVKAIIKQFNNAVVSFSSLFAFHSGLRSAVRLVGRAIALAASYIDEAIIAYMFTADEENPWRAARDGVVLYGKNWKPVLGSTLVIVLGMYAVAFALLLAMTPLASVLGGLSPALEVAGWVVVVGVVLSVYAGVLKPWVKTVVITTFLIESRSDTPDSETADRIASRSKKFRELTDEAETRDREPAVAPAD
ncbi:hypothetical protein [Natrarchaeobius chitinivorans]|uniref:Uncharacterized protein n=1 Tax=Natrarchaeobius chitinivorans TaxID=1679083 RepID=A0A3N6N5A8_NATCH|nr:hypothetical protein [Natrarchaeobius chitinivorans]RQG93432.1 hypothetical protein EA473_15525 [Natrarchaeobius chitinivorans]